MLSEAVDTAAVFASLSALDRAILRGAGSGLSSKQIAPLVQRSHHTVDDRLKVLKRRLGAGDRAEAGRMLIAFEAGMDPKDWGPDRLGIGLVDATPPHCAREVRRHDLEVPNRSGAGAAVVRARDNAGRLLRGQPSDAGRDFGPAGLIGVVLACAVGLSVIFAMLTQCLVMVQGLLEHA